MKARLFVSLLIAGLMIFSPKMHAEGGSAGTMSLFHSLVAGARKLGLGGACVAMPFDATTIYWNPAEGEPGADNNLTYLLAHASPEAARESRLT